MELKKLVRYEDFGAVGDGKTDDFDALARAHAYANKNGLDVVADGSKTYYIGKTEKGNPKPAINIKTNVDFGTATFIIDDSEIECDMPRGSVFHVDRDTEPVVYNIENDTPNGAIARINAEGGFPADIEKIDLGLGYDAMVVVVDETHHTYVRYGVNANAGSAQSEIINVDKNGNIDPATTFLHGYSMVTSLRVLKADKPITLTGGTFITIANRTLEGGGYYSRGIYITRANVTFRGLTYKIEGEGEHGNPYSGFLTFHESSNIVVEKCTLQAHKTYFNIKANGARVGMGTYGLSMGSSNNLLFKDCVQSNFFEDDGVTPRRGVWGIQGSNRSKNIVYENSILSRFDAHIGVRNANIKNSSLQSFRIIGGGDITIENCHVYSTLLCGLREDYGSTWRGNVIVKDVTLHNAKTPAAFMYALWANHNFGYQTYMPETIIIDNLRITQGDEIHMFTAPFVEQSRKIMNDEIDGAPNLNKMIAPKKVIVRNNRQGLKFILPDSDFFKDTEFIFEN